MVVDLIFFMGIRLNLPEWYYWAIKAMSMYIHIPVKATEALVLIGGFAMTLIVVSMISYILYSEAKRL